MTISNEVRPVSPIDDALDNIRRAHSRLEEQVRRTAESFKHVLSAERADQPAAGKEPVASTQSDLHGVLMQAGASIHRQADALADINDRSTL